jgi:hypothetical protein
MRGETKETNAERFFLWGWLTVQHELCIITKSMHYLTLIYCIKVPLHFSGIRCMCMVLIR